MPDKVTGFLTRDQQFYSTEPEARKHEAEMEIRAMCAEHKPRAINAETFLSALEAMADPILEYLNASNEVELPNPITRKHNSDDGLTKEIAKTIQSFETDGHEPVSNMGRRPPSKTIQD